MAAFEHDVYLKFAFDLIIYHEEMSEKNLLKRIKRATITVKKCSN
jgi:hypothetical protein